MKKKLIFSEKCQIYFHYGIFEINDVKFVKLLINFFLASNLRRIYPFNQEMLNRCLIIMNLYHTIQNLKKGKFKRLNE